LLAYCTPLADRLRILEAGHPAAQATNREMLAAATIAVPESLTCVAVDFERETLSERLEAAGFDAKRSAPARLHHHASTL
jgi:O-methyltransferase involved in polyketide biosynthesis